MNFYCVYRSGGDYTPEYVERLWQACQQHFPNLTFHCLSDDPSIRGYVPLKYDWKGYWSKLELFRPDIKGDIFFMDLDTVVVGNIEEEVSNLFSQNDPYMLSDFYFPDNSASGVMYLPEHCRQKVWDWWMLNPDDHMRRVGAGGDQKIIGESICEKRFDDLFPDMITSYKIVKPELLPTSVRNRLQRDNKLIVSEDKVKIICYHGKPRPHQVNWESGFNKETTS